MVVAGIPALAGSVEGFQFGKNALWRQTTASPGFSTADAVEWGAGAAVLQFPFDTAEDVTVSESATGASFPMTAYTYEDPVDAMPHEDWWGSATFESRDALLAVWPAGGTAQFVRTFPEWLETPPDSGSILLSAIEPIQIPEFTNFDAIQVIDPSQDFTFQWSPWSDPTGYIPFNIYGPDGEVAGAGLDGTTAEFTVPARTFQAGVTYRAVVNFSSGYFHTGTEWEGESVGWHYWNYRSEVEFTPRVPSRPLPELPTSSQFTRWRPLGDGWPDSDHGLGSLTWFQGQLHTADGSWGDGIAVGLISSWNGAAWDWPLTPLVNFGIGTPPAESDLGLLIMGQRDVLAWDGASWQSLGNGFMMDMSERGLLVSGPTQEPPWAFWDAQAGAVALPFYEFATATQGGDLYALAPFMVMDATLTFGPTSLSAIAHWDGVAWRLLVTVTPDRQVLPVYARSLVADGSDIFAGGVFALSDGAGGAGPVFQGVARWNGTAWEPVGGGFDGMVLALGWDGSSLHAGGSFSSAGGVPAANIARWTGTAWEPLGTGTDGGVRAIAFSGADLYAGGEFTNAGGIEANHIARWDGSGWSALDSGTDGPVSHFAVSPEGIYVSVDRYGLDGFALAGTKLARDVAFWPFATRLLTRDLTPTAAPGLPLRIPIADVAQDLDDNPVSVVSVGNGVRGGTVSADAEFIYYQPGDLRGDDAFTYRVSNGAEEATGTVRVRVKEEPSGSRAEQISVTSDSVTIRFSGVPGARYDVQRAESLDEPAEWTTLTTETALSPGADGSFTFTDAFLTTSTVFYRSAKR